MLHGTPSWKQKSLTKTSKLFFSKLSSAFVEKSHWLAGEFPYKKEVGVLVGNIERPLPFYGPWESLPRGFGPHQIPISKTKKGLMSVFISL